jgi:hypothetical protein
MAQKFVLTAQLQLQAPSNTGQVMSQIRKQLKGVNVDVKVKHNPKALKQANQQLKTISREGAKASKNVASLGKTMGQAARRFAAFSVATGVFLGIARAIKVGTTEAISFEKELLKISQVTGKSVRGLRELTSEVTRLSRTFGSASAELLNASRTLSQAGFSADKATKALQILAQTDLGATFNSITDTTEGAIAMLRQFRKEAQLAGGDIAFLEKSLSAINTVSKQFAVESADLITVIRRTGGVFEAAGGKLNELIALFTSVRATTRESAETIAVGFRTIFTRIQRVETIDQLKQLGIQLQDTKGQFVGPMQAIEKLSQALAGLDPRDFRFNQIVEQLGGFRQVGKVIPLIKQFATAQAALDVAIGASGSVAADAQTALGGLGQQAKIVREDFASLMREFVGTDAFRSFAKSGLELAKALMQIASALEPVLPMLTALAAIKIGRGLAPALSGFTGMRKMARGGMVPGSGNRDTVPALLTPGEFVIRKSSVNRMGVGQLKAMNENKFKNGGRQKPVQTDIWGEKKKRVIGGINVNQGALRKGTTGVEAGVAFLRSEGGFPLERVTSGKVPMSAFSNTQPKSGGPSPRKRVAAATKRPGGFPYNLYSGMLSASVADKFEDDLSERLVEVSTRLANTAMGGIGAKQTDASLKTAIQTQFNFENISGNIFEAAIAASGAPFTNKSLSNETFDFVGGLGNKASVFNIPSKIPTDAKRTFSVDSLASLGKKVKNKIVEDVDAGVPINLKGFAGGGKVDSIPAMLTPGEFVMNKASSQRIGYGSLNRMNKSGVAGFNAGGIVGFANGGEAGRGGVNLSFKGIADDFFAVRKKSVEAAKALAQLGLSTEQINPILDTFEAELRGGADNFAAMEKALQDFEINVKRAGTSAKSSVSQQALGREFEGLGGVDQSTEGVNVRMAKLKGVLDRLNIPFEKQVAVVGKFGEELEGGADTAKSLKKAFGSLGIEVKKQTTKGGKQASGVDEVAAKAQKEALEQSAEAHSATSQKLQRMSQATNQVSMGLLFAGGAVSTLATMFGDMSDEAKEQMNAGIATGTAIFALGNQVASMTLEIASNIMQRRAQTAANLALTTTTAQATVALKGLATSATTEKVKAKTQLLDQYGNPLTSSTTTKTPVITTSGGHIPFTGPGGSGRTVDMGAGDAIKPKPQKSSTTMMGGSGRMMAGMIAFQVALLAAAVAAGQTEAELVKMRQSIERLNESSKLLKDSLAETGEVSLATFQENRSEAASQDMVRAAKEANKGWKAWSSALLAGGAAGAAGAYAGAQAGGAYGTIGGAPGAVVGGTIGGALGGAGGFWVGWKASMKAAGEAAKKFTGEMVTASNLRAKAEYDSIRVIYSFNKAMKEAERGAYTNAQTLQMVADQTGNMFDVATTAQKNLDDAIEKRKSLEEKLMKKDIIKTSDGYESTKADKSIKAGDKARIATLNESKKQEEDARRAIQNVLKQAAANEKKARSLISATAGDIFKKSEAGGIFSDIPDLLMKEIGGKFEFKAVAGFDKEVAAMNAGLRTIQRSIQTEYEQRIKAAREQGEYTKAALLAKEATLAVRDAMWSNALAAQEQSQARRKANIAMLLETKIRLLQTAAINEATLAMRTFSAMAVESAKMFGQMDATIGAFTGAPMTSTVMGGQALEQLGAVDSNVLSNTLAAAFQGPIEVGGQFAQRIRSANDALEVVPLALQKLVGRSLEMGVIDSDKLIEGLIGNAPEQLKDVLKATIDQLQTQTGQLSFEDIEKVKGVITDFVRKDIEVARKLLDIQSSYVNQYAKSTQAIINMQNQRIAAEAGLVDMMSRHGAMMAQATGREESRQTRERNRTAAARERNQGLNMGMAGTNITGSPLLAGIQATFAAQEAAAAGARAARLAAEGPAYDPVLEQDTAMRARTGHGTTWGTPGMSTSVLTDQERERRQNAYTNSLNDANRETIEYSDKLARATQELERLANQTDRTADVMSELERERGKKATMKGILEQFVGGSFQDRAQMQQQFGAMNMAVQQGSLQGMPSSMRQGVMGLLDKLGDIEIRGAGGRTGKEVKDELVRRDAMRMGFDPKALAAIYDTTSKEDKLIAELRAIQKQELEAQRELIKLRKMQEQELINQRWNLQQNFFTQLNTLFAQQLANQQAMQDRVDATLADPDVAPPPPGGVAPPPTTLANIDVQLGTLNAAYAAGAKELEGLKKKAEGAKTALANWSAGIEEFNKTGINPLKIGIKKVWEQMGYSTDQQAQLLVEYRHLVAEIKRGTKGARNALIDYNDAIYGFRVPGVRYPIDRASGGMVYKAAGGSIFKPRGTDTVPAMLTPGEFVIKKSSVDKIGAGNLAALNNGGGTVYRAGGGIVGGGASYLQEGGPSSSSTLGMFSQNAGKGPLAAMYELWFGKSGFRGWAKEARAREQRGNEIRFLEKRLNQELKQTDSRGDKPHQLVKDRSVLGLGGMSDVDWENLTYYKLFGPGGRQYYNGPGRPGGLSGYQMPGRDWSNLDPLIKRGMAARKRRREREGPPVYAHREGQLEGENAQDQRWREELEGAQARLKDSYFRKMAATKLDLPAGNKFSPGSRVVGRELDYPVSGGEIGRGGEALINISTTFLEGMTEWAMNKLGGGQGLPLENSDIVRSRWGNKYFESQPAIAAWLGHAMTDQIFHGGVDYRQYSKDFDVLPSALLKKKASQWLSYLSSTKWSAGPEDAKTAIRADGAAWQEGRSDDGVPYSPESNLSTAGLIALNEVLEAVQFLPLSKQISFYGREGKARASSQVQEFNKGGQVRGYNMGGGVDTVPAMLTPGEFVMNARSVNKYGTGFMNQLNQGNYLARGGYPDKRPYTKAPAGVGSRFIDPWGPYWVDPFTSTDLAKKPTTLAEMRAAALANLMGPDPLSVNSTWEPVRQTGSTYAPFTYRQLALSQFKHHWENTPFIPGTSTKASWAAYDSKFKFLRMDKFGESDAITSPSDRPADPRALPDLRFPKRPGTGVKEVKEKPFLDTGEYQTFDKAKLPPGTPAWVRFEANMGNWLMEDAALYQRIAQAWFPEDHARQKDFTEALGWQWDAFSKGTPGAWADLQHYLGISGFNNTPTGNVRIQSDWFGKYASGQAKALMASAFGSDIDRFGFGHFTGKGATKQNVDELWAKKDSGGNIDNLASLYLDEKGRWGGQQHKLARFGWWKKEWQQALKSWSAMEGVDIRTPDQVEADFNKDMEHQAGRFAAGKRCARFLWGAGQPRNTVCVGQLALQL